MRLHDVRVGNRPSDARPGLVCEDVQDLDVRGGQAASAPGTLVAIDADVPAGRVVPD